MNFKIGDLVTRNSYNHDVVFKINNIIDENIILKGVNVRLCADSLKEDLVLCEQENEKDVKNDKYFLEKVYEFFPENRNEYFYLPGRILHVDGDKEYLERCLNFYKQANVLVYGIYINEEDMSKLIKKHLEELNPDILVITGHDSLRKKKKNKNDNQKYKNTERFITTVREARKFEKAYDKLIIIAGACQSDYEGLIKAGANFASSPKRINIHALDPAIIALAIALSDRNKDIDIIKILEKTKYGKDGLGGLITKGTMYIGYPKERRKE